MDLGKKKKLGFLDQKTIEALVLQLSQVESGLLQTREALTDAVDNMQITQLAENVYQLGHVLGIYEMFGGYVNRSFGIIVEKDGRQQDYFVRKYKMGITDGDIQVEHSLICYAAEHGMQTIARVYKTPDGKTFWRMNEIYNGQWVSRAFAIYEFLEGEDRYTWINTKLTPDEDRSFGRLLAQFHASTAGFDPGEKEELPIIPLLKKLAGKFPHCCDVLPEENRFRLLWEKELDHIMAACKKAYAYLSDPVNEKSLPIANCHCDFHPGNVKWTDNKCSGVFDFDWAKLDKRLFDVVYALIYTVTSWDSEDNGEIDLDRILYTVHGYEDELARHPGTMPPLTKAEWAALPYMFLGGIMYLLNWCISYCGDPENLNEFEYYFYLSHVTNALGSVERHWDTLANMEQMVHTGACKR